MQKEDIKKHIGQIIFDHGFLSTEDISKKVDESFDKQENNVRTIIKDRNGKKYVFKFSITGLTDKTKQVGIRAKLNLKNEILFYRETNKILKRNIVIPELIDSATDPESWLIIEFLNNAKIFSAKKGFEADPFPDFFADSFIKGIKEFQELKINQNLFNHTSYADLVSWLNSLKPVYTGKIGKLETKIEKLFAKSQDIWDQNIKYVAHMDIITDTIGYDLKSHDLVLLDFEKVQISNRANDFASLSTNMLIKNWNETYEKHLFETFKSKDFEILYRLSKLLRILSRLNNYKSGRLDHVFTEILGKPKFEEIKKLTIPLLEDEIQDQTSYLESLTK